MIARTPLLVASALLLALSAPAWAQYAGGAAGSQATTAAPSATTTKPSSFEALSAGDRKIGRALFLAQHPTASGPAPLSLNQIADLKAHGSWAKVFSQMQSRGLLQAKNLGQIVNSYQRSEAAPPARARNGSSGSPTLVTGGNGSVIASSQRGGISHGGDVVGETGTADIAAADKRSR
ncbi:MAG TPA: hypothetical protein VJO12_10850 [Stellaceae bacterium]|nr:hypothetical protein [Stellaceae bacterium]